MAKLVVHSRWWIDSIFFIYGIEMNGSLDMAVEMVSSRREVMLDAVPHRDGRRCLTACGEESVFT